MNSRINRLLTVILGVTLVAAVVGLVYFAAAPVQTTEPYTALYVLNEDGDASDYLTNLSVDQEGTVSVVVSNNEQREQTYTVVASTGTETLVTETVTLEDGERWKHDLTVEFDTPGEKEISVELYRGDGSSSEADPYRHVSVSTRVSE